MHNRLDKEIQDEKDALDQYSALTHIVLDMLESKKRECKLFFIALIFSLVVNVVIVGGSCGTKVNGDTQTQLQLQLNKRSLVQTLKLIMLKVTNIRMIQFTMNNSKGVNNNAC